jgi:DNA-binding MarR family transcriptional regulator
VAKAVQTETGALREQRIEEYDPRDHPAQLVRRVHQKGVHLFAQAVSDSSLSVTQFVALVTLLKVGPVPQSRLGRLASMDPSTTTVVIRRLVADGLIRKTRSESDQRTSVLELTPAGRDCAVSHIPASLHAGEALLSPLTPVERILFLELLRKILADLPVPE